MDYNNVDFNADVVALYSYLRKRMATSFDDKDFGPKDLPVADPNAEQQMAEEKKSFQAEVAVAKDLIKKGYNRVKEKIRAIRKAYNKAVTNGTRSGSGKVVQEYFDELAESWKGSPATEQLKHGIIRSESIVGSSPDHDTSTASSPMPEDTVDGQDIDLEVEDTGFDSYINADEEETGNIYALYLRFQKRLMQNVNSYRINTHDYYYNYKLL